MQDLLDVIKMKIKTMQATLIQLNEYEIHHEYVNIIRKEMSFYQHIAEELESKLTKSLLPGKIDKFIDLFCGGASVGLNVLDQELCNEVVFNDLHAGLIEFWQYGIHLINLDYLERVK